VELAIRIGDSCPDIEHYTIRSKITIWHGLHMSHYRAKIKHNLPVHERATAPWKAWEK
jgi:hypothetical protein